MAFRPAVRDETKVLVGIAGPSSSGKTYSALELGTGMVDNPAEELFMIDTENRRGLHYASRFKFQYDILEAPYTPARYLAKIREAKDAGAKCIVTDSMSHVHEGPGGILEWHEREITRMVGDRDTPQRREAMNFAAWAKPKAEWSVFRNTISLFDVHLIFCLRAKEKLKMVKVKRQGRDGGEREVNEPTPMGWQPIVTEHFEYEMTSLLVLPPLSEGHIDAKAEASKIIGDHRDIFRDGAQISRDMGRQLVAWAKGAEGGRSTLLQRGEEAAERGVEALRIWFSQLTRDQQRDMEHDKDRLKVEAAKADAARQGGGSASPAQQQSLLGDGDPTPKADAALLVPEGPTTERVMSLVTMLERATTLADVTAITNANADWTAKLSENMLSILDTARMDASAKISSR